MFELEEYMSCDTQTHLIYEWRKKEIKMELKHHINWIKVQRTFINTQSEPNKERSERNTSTNLISKTTIIL